MKFPKTIKIGPFDWSVNFSKKMLSRGWMKTADHSILLATGYKQKSLGTPDNQGLAEALLHECLHACWWSGQLESKETEEKAVEVLSMQLSSMFKNNPKLKEVFFG